MKFSIFEDFTALTFFIASNLLKYDLRMSDDISP